MCSHSSSFLLYSACKNKGCPELFYCSIYHITEEEHKMFFHLHFKNSGASKHSVQQVQ